jgi:hypothetical protein
LYLQRHPQSIPSSWRVTEILLNADYEEEKSMSILICPRGYKPEESRFKKGLIYNSSLFLPHMF